MARSSADVRAFGRRRGAGNADLVVTEVVEEVVQVHLEGLVLRLRVCEDVDAVQKGVHQDDAEDGGEEAEGERVRRKDLLIAMRRPAALACC